MHANAYKAVHHIFILALLVRVKNIKYRLFENREKMEQPILYPNIINSDKKTWIVISTAKLRDIVEQLTMKVARNIMFEVPLASNYSMIAEERFAIPRVDAIYSTKHESNSTLEHHFRAIGLTQTCQIALSHRQHATIVALLKKYSII